TPTYMDHYYLNFWLWACLRDGEAYLASYSAFHAMIAGLRTNRADILAFNKKRMAAQREMELAKYHFVTAIGSLVRNLEHSNRLFPSIEAACEKAQHLFAEGKLLRDMIEHADEYMQGKGREQVGFVREAKSVLSNFPGSAPGIADATSTIVDENSHWLGGRLNVQRVMREVQAIANEAAQIPAPSGRLPHGA
ncbi:MAG: hypothetical protein WBG18_01395, partial [Xanthobacteraceae bacterium]